MASFEKMAAERDRVYRLAANDPTHAVVDAAGRYGVSGAKVYYVGCRDKCIGRAKAGGLQVISLAGASVGDRVLPADVTRFGARFASER